MKTELYCHTNTILYNTSSINTMGSTKSKSSNAKFVVTSNISSNMGFDSESDGFDDSSITTGFASLTGKPVVVSTDITNGTVSMQISNAKTNGKVSKFGKRQQRKAARQMKKRQKERNLHH